MLDALWGHLLDIQEHSFAGHNRTSLTVGLDVGKGLGSKGSFTNVFKSLSCTQTSVKICNIFIFEDSMVTIDAFAVCLTMNNSVNS